jgi:hypothetical protein
MVLQLLAVFAVIPLMLVGTSGVHGQPPCAQGYVWREACPNDYVCVTPAVRDAAKADSLLADFRRNPGGGGTTFDWDTCIPGYVWREACGPNDHVSVGRCI